MIHLDRITENIKSIRGRTGSDRLICAPVKADAYGHGTIQIARASLKAGADYLGIAAVSEGIELRKEGIEAPVLLFSQPHPEEIPRIIKENLIPFISDADFADALNEKAALANKKLQVHIKIDTGMRRIGCKADESLTLARKIASCQGLELTGIATHLAVSDSTDERDIEYTKKQLEIFKNAVDAIKAAGINPGIIHAANSGAIILHPDSWLDMVRPGIMLYGYKTAEESGAPEEHYVSLKKLRPLNVKPVMELRSVVTLIKKVKKGEPVSYGGTWKAEEDTFIAILPAGYADGFTRLASNNWSVLINGEYYPIAGRICMDQCCVNLGPRPKVKRWDEAVIFGMNGADSADNAKLKHDAAALAEITGTIPNEITCNISRRVPREYKPHCL